MSREYLSGYDSRKYVVLSVRGARRPTDLTYRAGRGRKRDPQIVCCIIATAEKKMAQPLVAPLGR